MHSLPESCVLTGQRVDHGGKVDLLALADQTAVFESRHVEQLQDEAFQSMALLEQAIKPHAVGWRGGVSLGTTPKHLRLRNDACKRRLQVVRCRRQKVF